jgi:hypothetical protein
MKLRSEQHGLPVWLPSVFASSPQLLFKVSASFIGEWSDRSLQERKGKRGGKMFVRSSTDGVGDEQYSKPFFWLLPLVKWDVMVFSPIIQLSRVLVLTDSYIKKQHQRVDCELKIGAVISNLVHQAISI